MLQAGCGDFDFTKLCPADFELILDLLNAVHAPQRFLRHLLLKEAGHDAVQDDLSFARFKSQLAAGNVWV